MKFKAKRTSDWDKKPCKEAIKETYIRIDDRTTDDPAKIPAAHGESNWWYEEGKNHRIEHGRIMRDFDRRTYKVYQ